MSLMHRVGLKRANPYEMPTRRVLAALILVGTVLFCQGLFSVLHQFSDVDIPVVGHYSAIEIGSSGDHPGGHQGAWHCAAAILVVFLGASVLLLHKGTRIWSGFADTLLSNKDFPLSVFH